MMQDEIQFQTPRGAQVTVTAENGTLYVDVPSAGVSNESAHLTTEKRKDVLDAGVQRQGGDKFRALIPVGDHKADIEQLREDSTPDVTDEPLVYTVEEYSKGTGSWGQELTGTRLVVNKKHAEMTDRQKELHRKVDRDHDVPTDANDGDEYGIDEILDDTRTTEEKEQDAIEVAQETGDEIVITSTTTECNDWHKECNLDHVAKIATPNGEIKTRRTHTY